MEPSPARESLETSWPGSGDRVLQHPAELAEFLRDLQISEGEVLVHQTTLRYRPLLWLLLLGLLAIEWSLREGGEGV